MNTPTRSQLQHIGSLITYHTGTGETAHTITFNRKGKVYRGRLSEEGEAFNFRRVK